jgi:hypothetical protein
MGVVQLDNGKPLARPLAAGFQTSILTIWGYVGRYGASFSLEAASRGRAQKA